MYKKRTKKHLPKKEEKRDNIYLTLSKKEENA
jgi:hypothetical protein